MKFPGAKSAPGRQKLPCRTGLPRRGGQAKLRAQGGTGRTGTVALFLTYDQAALDRQYNNSAAVPEFPTFVQRWPIESKAVRARLGGHLDLAYGPHDRHRL